MQSLHTAALVSRWLQLVATYFHIYISELLSQAARGCEQSVVGLGKYSLFVLQRKLVQNYRRSTFSRFQNLRIFDEHKKKGPWPRRGDRLKFNKSVAMAMWRQGSIGMSTLPNYQKIQAKWSSAYRIQCATLRRESESAQRVPGCRIKMHVAGKMELKQWRPKKQLNAIDVRCLVLQSMVNFTPSTCQYCKLKPAH